MTARMPAVSQHDIDATLLGNDNAADHPPAPFLPEGDIPAAIHGVSAASSEAFFKQHKAVDLSRLTAPKTAGKRRRAEIFKALVTSEVHTAAAATQ